MVDQGTALVSHVTEQTVLQIHVRFIFDTINYFYHVAELTNGHIVYISPIYYDSLLFIHYLPIIYLSLPYSFIYYLFIIQ